MNISRRISPTEVVEAYKATGLRPIQHKWYDVDGCACGISAVYAVTHDMLYEEPETWADSVYGMSYVNGFVDGWDDNRINNEWAGDAHVGFADGKAAWQAVVQAGLVEEADADAN